MRFVLTSQTWTIATAREERWPMVPMPILAAVVMGTRDVECPTIARTAFLPAEVGWCRERLRQALVGSFGEENFRTPGFALVHDARILELLNQSFFAPTEKQIS